MRKTISTFVVMKIGKVMLLCVGLLLMLGGSAMADSAWTGGGADNLWTTAGNWDVVPGAGDMVTIDITNNNPLINTDIAAEYTNIIIGADSTEEVVLTVANGAYLRQNVVAGTYLGLGYNAGSVGRLEVTGGTINAGDDLIVGRSGSGTVNVSGGWVETVDDFVLGAVSGHGASTVNQTGGTIAVGGLTTTTDVATIGEASGGLCTLNVSGSGTLFATGDLEAGMNGGSGSITVSGGASLNVRDEVYVGRFTGSTGTLVVESGASFTVGDNVFVGLEGGATGTLVIDDASVIVVDDVYIGRKSGDGILIVTNGASLEIGTTGFIRLGDEAGSSGELILSGNSSIDNDGYLAIGYFAGCAGSMTMEDGSFTSDYIELGRDGEGTLTMYDGTIDVNRMIRIGQDEGEGVLNMFGGLIEATEYFSVGYGTTQAGETNYLHMTGGEIKTTEFRIGNAGEGIVNLSGGIIYVNALGATTTTNGLQISMTADGLLDITGDGALYWEGGDFTAEVNAYVLAGDIVASNGLGTVSVVYDSGSNTTIVKANSVLYGLWAASYGLSGDDALSSADPDEDGLNNLYEYGLGGNPTNSTDQGTSPEFGVVNVGGTNWFGYVHPQLPAVPDSGLSYSLELNTDLVDGTWTNFGYTVMGTNVTGGSLDFVTNVTSTIEDKKFIRLVIEEL